MSMQGNTDTVKSHPKFSLERQVRPSLVLSANGTSTTTANATTLSFVNTAGIANGMYISGNNINVSSQLPGFFKGNVVVTNFTVSTVTISSAISANVYAGDLFEFDKTFSYRTQQGLYPGTVLVSASRLANSKLGSTTNPVPAHTGWVFTKDGTGPVVSVNIVSGGTGYSNGYITFGGNSSGSGANASYTVNALGVINVTNLLTAGSLYNVAPTATVVTANTGVATFTVTCGGRSGRVFTEVLSVTSNAVCSNTSTGGKYFPNL